MLQRRLMDTFDDFRKDWLKSCSQLEEASNIPVAEINCLEFDNKCQHCKQEIIIIIFSF